MIQSIITIISISIYLFIQKKKKMDSLFIVFSEISVV